METAKLIETVSKARQGDESAIQDLYIDAYKSVYYLALRMVKNPDDAEDIMQDVFITVQEKITQLREPEAFYGWINQITANKCNRFLSKYPGIIRLDDENEFLELADDDPMNLPDKAIDDAETRKIILEVIENLPDAQRVCVMLFYYSQNTIAQIADALETNENTVKSRLALARAKIKAALEEKEKREGIKLYGFPIALPPILRQDMEQSEIPEGLAERVWESIQSALSESIALSTTGVATKASSTLLTKIAVGCLAGAVAIGGGVFLLSNDNNGETTYTPPATAPAETEQEQAQAQETEQSYYDSLSDEHKLMLSRLEAAIRAIDYQTAYDIQRSAEFHALCDAIPYWGGFWYFPDDETSIMVYRTNEEIERSYTINMFIGTGGNGYFHHSRYGGFYYQNYCFAVARYVDGVANGPFRYHVFNYRHGATEFHQQWGELRNGAAYGTVFVTMGGETFEEQYEVEWYNWWPDWPER